MIDKEMSRGIIKILILSSISVKDMYGYLIIKEINQKSNGVFDIKDGTIYPILHSLEKDRDIESFWKESSVQRKRKYYKITPSGQETLKKYQFQWNLLKNAVDSIIGEENEKI